MVDKLVTLCATMNEFPYIRYIARDPLQGPSEGGSSSLPCVIAETLNTQLIGFVGAAGAAFRFHENRSTVLIVDRIDDLIPTDKLLSSWRR